MAMVKCPECKESISNKADTCPHCGMKQSTIGIMTSLKIALL